ncbi:MAG: hypothetical protein WBF89_19860 [Steroidobacteraceae bacterium]
MGQRSHFLTAGLFGIGLAVLATVVTGWLAALPFPAALVRDFNHQSTVIFIFYSVACIGMPILVLSIAAGLVLFRVLRRATVTLALVCAAPWALYCAYDMSYAFISTSTRPALLFSLLTWSSLFIVPAGLVIASLFPVAGSPASGSSDQQRQLHSGR